jgi:hypothetical protein
MIVATAASAMAALATSWAAEPPAVEDAYPADITPPAGTRYPCALPALPRALPGIPEADRAYINRTYARVLRAEPAPDGRAAFQDDVGQALALQRAPNARAGGS